MHLFTVSFRSHANYRHGVADLASGFLSFFCWFMVTNSFSFKFAGLCCCLLGAGGLIGTGIAFVALGFDFMYNSCGSRFTGQDLDFAAC